MWPEETRCYYCFPLPCNLQSAEIAGFIVVVMDIVQLDMLGLHAVVVNFRFPFPLRSPKEVERGGGEMYVCVIVYCFFVWFVLFLDCHIFSIAVPIVRHCGCFFFFLVGLRNMVEIFSTLLWLCVSVITLPSLSGQFAVNYMHVGWWLWRKWHSWISCRDMPGLAFHFMRTCPSSREYHVTISPRWIYIYIYISRRRSPSGAGHSHYQGFTVTLRHTTLGTIPLDEWSARRRDFYLTTHYIHNRKISMFPAEFEPTIPTRERP